MKFGFYPKLALDGIRKNRQMYLPYILTCVGMVMMTYIITFLKFSPVIAGLYGGSILQEIMAIGIVVILFFATLFLFYTNSFLTKRRKKEFGLYNILGMGKGNLGRILFWESVFLFLIAISAGLFLGIAFSKLAELGIVNLMEGEITYSMSVPVEAIVFTIVPFATIFALLFLNSVRQVWCSNVISLLKSENTGEKPPRANWVFGILGVVLLGVAYYLAVTIKDPLSALVTFLIAVLMVILATYLLLISGSVLFCRILQKNQKYYYKPNHFVSLSSMVYRMKRNGAGLASICILATMVLVMISSTSALFIGSEEVIGNRYPREIDMRLRNYENRPITDEDIKLFDSVVDEVLERYGAEQSNVMRYRSVTTSGLLQDGTVWFDQTSFTDFQMSNVEELRQIYLMPLEDYNAMMGENKTLADDEVLIYSPRSKYKNGTFGFVGLKEYRVKEVLKDCFISPDMSMDIVSPILAVVPDVTVATQGLVNSVGNYLHNWQWYYCFDTSLGADEDIALHTDLKEAFKALQLNGHDTFSYAVESREYERLDFYSLYGGMFYLGVILSIVFIIAAVLIIYYKQISEGYEDQSRFEIMQKVGMTKKEIRRSINSQLLTVFFLPLLMAGLHLAFAFPLICKLLLLFNLHNAALFAATALGSFLVFALFYTLVWRITSNSYYRIVSGGREENA